VDLPELAWERYRNFVVLTGAGISAASGLRPYRGPGGLWSPRRPDFDEEVLGRAEDLLPRLV
jgi:NAD-dependent SIR2 family protein deacetylase